VDDPAWQNRQPQWILECQQSEFASNRGLSNKYKLKGEVSHESGQQGYDYGCGLYAAPQIRIFMTVIMIVGFGR